MAEDNDAFAKDLAYLDKFFDKIESHSASLAPDAGARLKSLIADERGHWAEIRKLCAGEPARAALPAPAASSAMPTKKAPARAGHVGTTQRFTVGSTRTR